jgi:hypothetical protein
MPEQASNVATMPELSRRELLATAAGIGGLAITAGVPARAATTTADFRHLPPYGHDTLPAGVRACLISNVNGLTVNIPEAGFETWVDL